MSEWARGHSLSIEIALERLFDLSYSLSPPPFFLSLSLSYTHKTIALIITGMTEVKRNNQTKKRSLSTRDIPVSVHLCLTFLPIHIYLYIFIHRYIQVHIHIHHFQFISHHSFIHIIHHVLSYPILSYPYTDDSSIFLTTDTETATNTQQHDPRATIPHHPSLSRPFSHP